MRLNSTGRSIPVLEHEVAAFQDVLKIADLDHDPRDIHRVQFYILILFTAGVGKHTIDFKDIDCSAGTVLTIRKNQLHRFHDTNLKGSILIFTEEFVLSHLESRGARQIQELFNELLYEQNTELNQERYADILAVLSEIQKEYSAKRDAYTSNILRNLLQVLVSRLHRYRSSSLINKPDGTHVERFLRFQELVERDCMQSRSVTYYLDMLNVTTRTLNNTVQAIIGKSTKTLIDEILVNQIKRMLINSDLSVKEIAYDAGFDEPSNLFKFFKRHVHFTPEEFRSAHT